MSEKHQTQKGIRCWHPKAPSRHPFTNLKKTLQHASSSASATIRRTRRLPKGGERIGALKNNSPTAWARDLFKPCIDGYRWRNPCSLDWKKLSFGCRVFVEIYIMRGCLCIFVYIWMTSSFPGSRRIKAISWLKIFWFLGYNVSLWNLWSTF